MDAIGDVVVTEVGELNIDHFVIEFYVDGVTIQCFKHEFDWCGFKKKEIRKLCFMKNRYHMNVQEMNLLILSLHMDLTRKMVRRIF